jgi:hypothetical protein
MPIQSITQIKDWFRTGKKPTQGQFWDWIDSFVHKNDGIAINNVAGLQAALDGKVAQAYVDSLIQKNSVNLVSGQNNQSLAAGKLITYIVIISATTQSVFIENTLNAADIVEVECEAGIPMPLSAMIYAQGTRNYIIRTSNPATAIIYIQ